MKIAYFHLRTADNDDHALGDAKVMGYVPDTCLLGGSLVWKNISLELDPCAQCNGPREKCKGRPLVMADASTARIGEAFRLAREAGLTGAKHRSGSG